MPTNPAKARFLLKEGKAKVVRRMPFTIQLTVATGESVQAVTLGVDSGYRHVGLSASSEKAELYASEVVLRNDVADLLSKRRALRRARRNRKTRYRAPRFDNRVRSKHKGWLAPSVENRIAAHLSRIEAVLKLLPITKIVVETASFDLQKIKNPEIQGKEYQEGQQLGFWNVREYVLFRDGHRCVRCTGKSKDPILNVHHLESRRTGGNAPNNLVTLCETCHKQYHQGLFELAIKRGRKTKAETFMGIMRPEVLKRLRQAHPEIEIRNTFGYLTKNKRIRAGLPKSHCANAFCIAGNMGAKRLGCCFFQKQTRKHNRKIHKLRIEKKGKRKMNQGPYLVHGFRRFDKVRAKGVEGFINGRRIKGSFEIKTIEGEKLFEITFRKLRLVEKRKTFLIQLKNEAALPLPVKTGSSRAE